MQERPGSVPAGRLPRHRDVILFGSLVDKAKPGEEIVRLYLCIIMRYKYAVIHNTQCRKRYDIPSGLIYRHMPPHQVVTGTYRIVSDPAGIAKDGFPVFPSVIEANHIANDDLYASFRLTEDDESEIRELAKDEQIVKRVSVKQSNCLSCTAISGMATLN